MSGKAEQKSFTTPDETRSFDYGALDLLQIGGAEIGFKLTLQPGWRWSGSCQAAGFKHRAVRGTPLPVPRGRDAARGDGRRRRVRRPARRRHRAAPGPRRLGGRGRAGRGGGLVRRQQHTPAATPAVGQDTVDLPRPLGGQYVRGRVPDARQPYQPVPEGEAGRAWPVRGRTRS